MATDKYIRLVFALVLLTVAASRFLGQAPVGMPVNRQQAEAMALLDSLDKTPALGEPGAPVVIVEFGDYQCPHCAEHAQKVLPQIIAAYVKTGRVRYFFKDTPIEAVHPQAFKAAQAALCAGDQKRYWEMHDRLFKNQKSLAAGDLAQHAAALGLEVERFQQCLDNDVHAAQIRRNIQDALKSGARGTPTFLVGTSTSQGKGRRAVTVLSSTQPFSRFQEVVDQLLAAAAERGVH
jgi:protein-disulfide isomerase